MPRSRSIATTSGGRSNRCGGAFSVGPLAAHRREEVLQARRRDHPQHDQVAVASFTISCFTSGPRKHAVPGTIGCLSSSTTTLPRPRNRSGARPGHRANAAGCARRARSSGSPSTACRSRCRTARASGRRGHWPASAATRSVPPRAARRLPAARGLHRVHGVLLAASRTERVRSVCRRAIDQERRQGRRAASQASPARSDPRADRALSGRGRRPATRLRPNLLADSSSLPSTVRYRAHLPTADCL